MSTNLDGALSLSAQGCAVFPCAPDKRPLVQEGFRAATCDPEQIRAWWAEFPEAQVGIWPARCEPPLLVVDVDVKHGAPGMENLLELADILPPTFEAGTPSGGLHLYYRLPAGASAIGNRPLAPGVDLRSENGYVVWYGAGQGPEPIEAPAALLERAGQVQERADNAAEWLVEPDLPANIARARDFLARTAPAVEGQGGNAWTYATAEILRDYGLSEDGALAAMLEGWNDRCAPPWSPDELETIIANAYRYAKRPAGNRCADVSALVEAAQAAAPSGPAVTNAADCAEKDVSFLWYPYLLTGNHINVLAGRGGSGKGLVAMSIAAAVTRGGEMPGGERVPAGRVLWCETEDPRDEVLVGRLKAAGADLRKVDFINRGATLTKDLIREYRLIVLSPLLAFMGLRDVNDGQAVRAAFDPLQEALEGAPTALLGICHINKKADQFGNDRLLGSVEFANVVRSLLMVAPDPDLDGMRLAHTKHNNSVRGDDLCYRAQHVGERRESQRVRVQWSAAGGNVDASSMFEARKREDDTAGGWLAAYLEGAGEVDYKIVVKDAKASGHTEAALQRAKRLSRRIEHRFASTEPGQPPSTLWWLTPA